MQKKNVIILSIVLSIIFMSVGVGAATIFNAKDVSYTPKDASWGVDNLSDAIDDLYEKSSDSNYLLFPYEATAFSMHGWSSPKEVVSGQNITSDVADHTGMIVFFKTARDVTITSTSTGTTTVWFSDGTALKIGAVNSKKYSNVLAVSGVTTQDLTFKLVF